MDQSKVALGRWGEGRVARLYEAAGYEVVDRNWYGPAGEIDLVLCRGDEIVFCEVKTRSSARFGSGLEAVDARKQAAVRTTALRWLDATGRRGRIRFDVAAVAGARIDLLEGAF